MRISRGACTTLGYDPPCYVNRDFSINNVRALRGGTLENAVKREKKARKMNPAAVNRVERNARIDTHTHTRVRAHAHCLSLSLSTRRCMRVESEEYARKRGREREGTKRERTYVRTYVRSVIRGKTGRCASDASRRVVGKRLTPWRPPAPPDAAHAPYLKQLVHPCSQCRPKTTGDFIFFDKKPVNLPPSPPTSHLPLLLFPFYLSPLLLLSFIFSPF